MIYINSAIAHANLEELDSARLYLDHFVERATFGRNVLTTIAENFSFPDRS